MRQRQFKNISGHTLGLAPFKTKSDPGYIAVVVPGEVVSVEDVKRRAEEGRMTLADFYRAMGSR